MINKGFKNNWIPAIMHKEFPGNGPLWEQMLKPSLRTDRRGRTVFRSARSKLILTFLGICLLLCGLMSLEDNFLTRPFTMKRPIVSVRPRYGTEIRSESRQRHQSGPRSPHSGRSSDRPLRAETPRNHPFVDRHRAAGRAGFRGNCKRRKDPCRIGPNPIPEEESPSIQLPTSHSTVGRLFGGP